ncbi:MAG: hypothetical protein JO318_04465 [Chloroflexi bacterium]|nr:hypothetical protein [Chloroflexota bacterium]
MHVAPTDEQARREALEGAVGRDYRDYFLPLLGQTRGLSGLKLEESMSDADLTLEYLCDKVWIVGSPATVAGKIRELHASVGGFGGLLIGATDWSDPSIWQRSMDLFAGEVVPQLADLGAETSVGRGVAA